jgi:hypothetical protein
MQDDKEKELKEERKMTVEDLKRCLKWLGDDLQIDLKLFMVYRRHIKAMIRNAIELVENRDYLLLKK